MCAAGVVAGDESTSLDGGEGEGEASDFSPPTTSSVTAGRLSPNGFGSSRSNGRRIKNEVDGEKKKNWQLPSPHCAEALLAATCAELLVCLSWRKKAVRPVAPLPPAGQPHPVAKEASMAEEVGQPLMKAMERGNNDDGR
ncbi:hypothetical protein DAI22_08g174450 [Oryza sativa Japonica Group]|nr:hypothetical protein DAI22_08g174450 [Oryza sativa Japonica Group]